MHGCPSIIVLLRETYFSFSEKFVHDISHCPSKETEVPEVVGMLTLVVTRPRAGESRSSRDFTNKLVTLKSLSPLIFLALSVILGIEFPWSLHLADLWRRVSALFKLPGEANTLPNQAKNFSRRSLCLGLFI